MSAKLQHEAEQLLYRQAALLDDKQWRDWIDLFTPDGIYWIFSASKAVTAMVVHLLDHASSRSHALHPDAWSQKPLWGTNHVVSNVIVDKAAKNGDLVVRSRFHMMELRRDDVRHFAGQYTHHLKKVKSGYRIKLQRVDMTNAQAAYDYVLQVWV